MAQLTRFERGETVKLRAVFRTPKTAVPPSTLIDPVTVSLTIRLPTGVSTTYLYGDSAIVKDETGKYSFPLSLDIDGTYHWRWEGANSLTVKGVVSGTLDSARNPNF
jgi:hypothetical protein